MSSLYMLDTDTCAFILRRSSAELLDRIQTVPLEHQVMSMVTLAELLYGVQLSSMYRLLMRCHAPAREDHPHPP